MRKDITILGQMLQTFSRYEFGKAVKEAKTEHHARGFSSWKRHFGHVTVTADPFNQVWLKIIKEPGTRQFAPPYPRPLSSLPLGVLK